MCLKNKKSSVARSIVALLLCCIAVNAYSQTDYASLILGPADPVSVDQPRVTVEVIDPDSGAVLGPVYAGSFLLDTGAQGMMAVGYAVTELIEGGLVIDGIFDELGIGGLHRYDLSAPYRFDFSGSDYQRITLGDDIRFLSNEEVNFGSFGGIVGTPAMVGRVVELDMVNLLGDINDPYGFGFDYMGVFFSENDPPFNANRYSVDVTLFDFPPPVQQDPEAPLPTYGPLPFVVAGARNGSYETLGDFVLDTGAQVSMLSSTAAFALGLDANNNGILTDEAVGMTEFQGAGGSIEVPILEVEKFVLPTAEGVDLVWTNLELPVYDIDESIVGILGSDLLTTGWFRAVFDTRDTGAFERVWLDFRDYPAADGAMYLDVAMMYDQIEFIQHPQGDADRNGDVDISDFLRLKANYGSTQASWGQGDFNGDNIVDISDFLILKANYGTVSQ